MRVPLLVALVLATSACGREPTAEEKARADARAVAMVEAAQKQRPPLIPVEPEPFARSEIADAGLSTVGCAFVPAPASQSGDLAVFFAGDVIGTLKRDGRFIRLAADTGSARLPGGGFIQYVGKSHSLRLTLTGDAEATATAPTARPTATLAVRDAWERVVYSAAGLLDCGA